HVASSLRSLAGGCSGTGQRTTSPPLPGSGPACSLPYAVEGRSGLIKMCRTCDHNARVSRSPVPLPAEHIPPGTADWRTPDAQRWLAAVPTLWAHPLWAILAWVLSIVWELEAG